MCKGQRMVHPLDMGSMRECLGGRTCAQVGGGSGQGSLPGGFGVVSLRPTIATLVPYQGCEGRFIQR